MLFFFELGLFLLVMATLILGEFVGRGAAVATWLVATTASLAGYLLARRSLARLAAGQPGASPEAHPSADTEPHAPINADSIADDGAPGSTRDRPAPTGVPYPSPPPLDARWARTLLHYWGRTNGLLLVGTLAVLGWYWLTVPIR